MMKRIAVIAGYVALFVGAYTALLIGAFVVIDAFVPKSKPTTWAMDVREFAVGLLIVGLAYLLIRRTRCAFRRGGGAYLLAP
jgi:hypothetical protein